jgi:hypothetical protein
MRENMKYSYLVNKKSRRGHRALKKTVSVILALWRTIRLHIVSDWLLILVFSCLAAYLIFPGPLDPLAFILWPAEAGTIPSARVSFTISGTTSYPGIVSLNITITNIDIITHDYAILAVIGSYASQEWYGPGWYRDNLAACTDVQNIPDPWYDQAFICTGSLRPGQFFQVTRRIEIENNPRITDALVIVYNKYDATKEFGRSTKSNVINQ